MHSSNQDKKITLRGLTDIKDAEFHVKIKIKLLFVTKCIKKSHSKMTMVCTGNFSVLQPVILKLHFVTKRNKKI
jgi:hypothetical protein